MNSVQGFSGYLWDVQFLNKNVLMGTIFHWPHWYPKETTTLVNDKLLKKSVLVLKKEKNTHTLQEIVWLETSEGAFSRARGQSWALLFCSVTW